MIDVDHDIEQAIEILKEGGVIAYPCDTVWGIGCDATNSAAIKKLIAIKGRAPEKGIIALCDSKQMVKNLTGKPFLKEISNERPTTVIFPKAKGLAPEMLAPDGSAALRITREFFSLYLCRGLGKPIASTSANFSGEPTAQIFDDISPELLEKMDYVMESGHDYLPSKPSRILKINKDQSITVIRE